MTQKYQVKVSMKQAAIVETGIVLKQGDFGMQIEIEVLDFDVTGTTPQIVFRKAMGAVESTTITVSSNKYTYTFKGTELDTPGKVFCDLKLKNSTTQRISTASCMFKVVADTLDGLAEESSSYSDTIAQLMENCIQKSETEGLMKNDGTVDTNTYTKKADTDALKESVEKRDSYFHKRAGKNILDLSDLVINYSINSEGKLITNADALQTTRNYSPIEGGQTYIISNNGSTSSLLVIAFYTDKSEESFISRQTNVTGTFTAPATANYIRVTDSHYYLAQWTIDQIYKSQIEKGTTATAWQPPYENINGTLSYSLLKDIPETQDTYARGQIVENKNIAENINSYYHKFAGKNYLDTSDVVTGYSVNSEGKLVENPSLQSTRNFSPIDGGATYVYSNDGTYAVALVIAFYTDKTENSFISRLTNVTTSFTAPATANYFRITDEHYKTNTWTIDQIQKSQVEKSSTFSEYEPHAIHANEQIDYNSIVNEPNKRIFDMFAPARAWASYIETGTAADGYYDTTGTEYFPSVGQTTITAPCEDGDAFLFTGKVLGSAAYPYAAFWDENDNLIKIVGRSSSTAQQFTDLELNPPVGTRKVTVTGYTADNSPIYLKKAVYAAQSGYVPAVDKFMGHNQLPYFDTDYCHLICYGQSLSNGSDSLYVTDPALDKCYILGALATPSAALNPLRLTSGNQHPIVSAVNCLHDLIWNNTGLRPALIAGSYGTGGQSIAQLMSPTRQAQIKEEEEYTYDIVTSGRYQVFLDSLTYGKQVADTNKKSISCPVIFYLQGERDYYTDEELGGQPGSVVQAYACGDDKDKYKLYMKRLKEDMQAACIAAYGQKIKPLFAIYQVSGGFVKKHDMGINMAQVEFAEENDDVILLPSPYFTPNYNTSHLTTNGYRWYGEYMAAAAFQTLIQRSKYRPLQVVGAAIEGNNIRLKVSNGYLPLAIDAYTVEQTSQNGFVVWKDDQRYTVQGVELFGDEIILKTGVDLSSGTKIEVCYGGYEVGGSGNIRDNAPFVAMYNYWDDSNDHGQSGNLTISHVPTDKDGNSMVGKKYPMYNWLSGFYLKIE